MKKRVSSRAVIIENGKILVIFRRKLEEGKISEYYVIPGGGKEENETLEENVKRELYEEMNIKIDIIGYLGKYESNSTIEHYFHCKIKEGTPILSGEEKNRMSEKNYYEIRFEDINNLKKLKLAAENKVIMATEKKYENRKNH